MDTKGVKMKDCRFYVDEDARTVVCVIPNTRDMLLDFVSDHANFPDFDMSYIRYNSRLSKELEMPGSFIGKAVCAPEDKFDAETGSLIAYNRAKAKCYKSFFKRANRYVQKIDGRLNEMITVFNDFGLKIEDKQAAVDALINNKMTAE